MGTKNINCISLIQVCFKAKVSSQKWILDNRCSRHMTGDKSKFVELNVNKKHGTVTFGDNRSCEIIGKGKIGNGKVNINNVHLVNGLEFNLISVSQLMDNEH